MGNKNDIADLGQAQPEPRSEADAGQVDIASRIEEVVQKVLPTAIDSALSEYERRQQSARDKLMHRINQRFEEHAALLRELGHEITPDVEKRIREKASEEVRAENQSAPAGEGQKPSGGSVDQTQNLVAEAVDKILASFGVTIEDSDPEAAIIASSKNTAELLANVAKAAKDKADRVSQTRKPAGGVPLTTGSQPASDPLSGVTDPDQIWLIAKQRLRGGR